MENTSENVAPKKSNSNINWTVVLGLVSLCIVTNVTCSFAIHAYTEFKKHGEDIISLQQQIAELKSSQTPKVASQIEKNSINQMPVTPLPSENIKNPIKLEINKANSETQKIVESNDEKQIPANGQFTLLKDDKKSDQKGESKFRLLDQK